MADTDIRELAEAALRDDKAATPGPWFIAYSAVLSEPLVAERARVEVTIPVDAPDEAYEVLPDTAIAFVPVVGGDTPTLQGGKDGTFIAAARTREPELARALLRIAEAVTDWQDIGTAEDAIDRVRAVLGVG